VIENEGINIEDRHRQFKAHATLAYCTSREYDGPTPTGDWKCEEIELWASDGKSIDKYKLG